MTAPQQPPAPQQVVRVKRPVNPWMIIGWLIVGTLVLCGGGSVLAIALGSTTTTTTTTTVAASSSASTIPGAPPTTITEAAAYVPVPTDFALEVIELERSCFGSAGCNVTYTIGATYTGQPTTDPFTVIYDVAGAEGGKTGNLVIEGTTVTVDDRDSVQVPTGGTLVATPSRVIPGG